jgi:hypothetical protein
MNNPLTARTTKAFASQLIEQAKGDAEAALDRAFLAAYSRPASPREREIAKAAVAAAPGFAEGLRLFVQAMFGANDFLYTY